MPGSPPVTGLVVVDTYAHWSFVGQLFILVLVQIPRIGIHNDITSLYTPSERMLRSETNASKAMGYLDTTYAIIEGTSENDALETELEFVRRLDELKGQGLLDGYVATVSFVPPYSEQNLSRS